MPINSQHHQPMKTSAVQPGFDFYIYLLTYFFFKAALQPGFIIVSTWSHLFNYNFCLWKNAFYYHSQEVGQDTKLLVSRLCYTRRAWHIWSLHSDHVTYNWDTRRLKGQTNWGVRTVVSPIRKVKRHVRINTFMTKNWNHFAHKEEMLYIYMIHLKLDLIITYITGARLNSRPYTINDKNRREHKKDFPPHEGHGRSTYQNISRRINDLLKQTFQNNNF